jgi:hypothetical protein
MNENIIAFNATNWVTVIVMAFAGFFVIGALQKLYQQKHAPPAATSSN